MTPHRPPSLPLRAPCACFLAAILASLPACDAQTRVALAIDGDEDVRAQAASLQIEALVGAQRSRMLLERVSLSGPDRLPREIPLDVPSEAGVVRVRLIAAGAGGAVVARRLVSLRLTPGAAFVVRVRLESACAAQRCDEERDQTCRAGACVDARPQARELVERPTDDTDLLELGRRLERRGEHDEAIRVYSAAIDKYHNNYEAAYRIAHLECFGRKDASACRRWSARLASLEPGSPRARRLVTQAEVLEAGTALAAGQLERAARLVAHARRQDPANPDASMMAGRVAEARGEVVHAAESYRAALGIRPGWRAPCRRLAALFERIGRPRAAAPWHECVATGRAPGRPAAPR